MRLEKRVEATSWRVWKARVGRADHGGRLASLSCALGRCVSALSMEAGGCRPVREHLCWSRQEVVRAAPAAVAV